MKNLLITLALVFIFCGVSKAQKGTAESGYYPPAYTGGDTWTGEVTAVDESKQTITLTYKNKKKDETFTGVLVKDYWGPKDSNGNYQQGKLSLLMGYRVRAYYTTKTVKDSAGVKTKEYRIHIIKVVPKDS